MYMYRMYGILVHVCYGGCGKATDRGVCLFSAGLTWPLKLTSMPRDDEGVA